MDKPQVNKHYECRGEVCEVISVSGGTTTVRGLHTGIKRAVRTSEIGKEVSEEGALRETLRLIFEEEKQTEMNSFRT